MLIKARTGSKQRGVMLVLSSPSGAGKSTLARLLLEKDRNITLSISVTTRARRPSEINGVHYRFLSIAEFEEMKANDGLLESAEVHGNFYGTPREPVEVALKEGSDVLFDVDWQGALQLYDTARADVASIFILPPSMTELRARLDRRAEDAPEVIARRLSNAREELKHWREYDYVLVNSDLAETYDAVQIILAAERRRRDRHPDLEEFIDNLINQE